MKRAMMIALVLLAVPLAGCMEDDGGTGMEPVEVAWVQQPQDMKTGQTIDMTWELTGPEREVQHTGVHWANESVSDPSSPADYGNSAGVTEPATVPDEYSASETIDEAGTYYFRAHAIVDGDHIWTTEVEVQVNESSPTDAPIVVTMESAPENGTIGENVTVEWRLTGTPSEVQHTGFHWANESVSDPSSPADYGNSAGVTEPADVPGTYNGTWTEDEPGTYHGRAHAIYQGSHYWSDEITIEFEAAGNDTGEETGDNVTIEIHDESIAGLTTEFRPQNATVAQGGNVTWTNLGNATHSVDWDNESLEDSPDIAPGENWTWMVPDDLEPGDYQYRDGGTSPNPAIASVEVVAAE